MDEAMNTAESSLPDEWPQVEYDPPPKPSLFHRCQWIGPETQVTIDDSCKCMAEVAFGQIYCAAHHAIAYRPFTPRQVLDAAVGRTEDIKRNQFRKLAAEGMFKSNSGTKLPQVI